MKNLIEFCRKFRTEVLKMTLLEVEQKTHVPLKTISGFENGRSTNINHLNIYYSLCTTKEQRGLFIDGFDKAMDKDRL